MLQKILIVISLYVGLLSQIKAQCQQPLYIAFMTHLEDEWLDNNNPAVFNNHKNRILLEISFFKPYGAKVNFESAPPFLNGCYNWNDNVFQMLLDSSMGVGGHSNNSDYYDSTYALVRGLINYNQLYLGTSGGVGSDTLPVNNWVDSAVQAGYNYINGIPYSAWLQVPQSQRPNQDDNATVLNKHHDPLFPDLSDNIFPRRIQSGFTFHTDTTGPVLLICGSIGTFNKLQEGFAYCDTASCPLDSADVDTFLLKVNQAISIHNANPSKIACVYMHVPLNTISPQNKKFFDYLFQSLSTFYNNSDIQYATMSEIYQAFINCEATATPEYQRANDIKIIPNPATSNLTVYTSGFSGMAFIRDISGKIVSRLQLTGKQTAIDISRLQKGMYFLHLSGYNTPLRFIKQ